MLEGIAELDELLEQVWCLLLVIDALGHGGASLGKRSVHAVDARACDGSRCRAD
jgi:hypothetical protein